MSLISMSLLFALGCALLALIFGGASISWILNQPAGSERMREISAAVQEGAQAYLNRQYTTIAGVGLGLMIAKLFFS